MFTLVIHCLLAAVGFMMAFLYKKATTTSRLLNPNPQIPLKAFIGFFITSVVVTYLLSYFTTRALVASPIAEEGNIRYQNLKSVMFFSINLCFFAMVILANIFSQSQKKFAPIPYVLACGFYGVFILKDAYYITDYYLLWQKSLQLAHGVGSDYIKTAWTKCFMALVVTCFNALMVWWSLRK